MGCSQRCVHFFSAVHPLVTEVCLAGAVFDFYQNLNQFYGVLAECCTAQSCPTMSAGPKCVSIWYSSRTD